MQKFTDEDKGWLGVNMRIQPALLPKMMAAEAINKRFVRGVAATRKGVRKLPWTCLASDPLDRIPAKGEARGAGMWRDPVTDEEWIIYVAGTGAWKCREAQGSTPVRLPEGVSITGRVRFTQCMNVLVMHRGAADAPLVMTNVSEGFKPVVLSPAGSGTQPMPNASVGLYFQNRLWVPYDHDYIGFSDFLDYTRWDPTLAFRIEQGQGDSIVALAKWNDTTIIVFKTRSVHALTNLIPDQSGGYGNAYLDTITAEYGCAGPDAIVQVGSDLWFLSPERGLVSLRQTETNKIQGVDLPVSDSIQPLINRIDWNYADNATLSMWDNKVYLAVPFDSPRRLGTGVYDGWSALMIYDAGGSVFLNVTAGKHYYWRKGANEYWLGNGSQLLTESSNFIAQGAQVEVNGIPGEVASFELHEERYGYNNSVLVYDLINKAWAGRDQSDALRVQVWLRFLYGGQTRLGFLDDDGWLNLYEDGPHDHIGHVVTGMLEYRAITDKLVTRGLLAEFPGRKRVTRIRFNTATWHGQWRASVKSDGTNEIQQFAMVTADRTKFRRPAGKADYDPTNVNDDFDDPYRQDYSVAIASGSQLSIGSGLDLSRLQEEEVSYRIRLAGDYVQLEHTSSRGRCELRNVWVQATKAPTRRGIHS